MVSIILNYGLLKITGCAFLVYFSAFLSSNVTTEGGSAMEVMFEKTGNNGRDDKGKTAVPTFFLQFTFLLLCPKNCSHWVCFLSDGVKNTDTSFRQESSA